MKPTHTLVMKQGMIAGVLSYLTTIIYYAIYNVATGRPLIATAATIGTALFGRAGTSGMDAALAFNGVHLLASLALGMLAAWLLYEVEVHPVLWVSVLFLFIIGFLGAYWFLAITLARIAQIPPFALVLGNALGGAAMVGYLARMHRGLLTRIERFGDPEASLTSKPTGWRS